jgi:hypothetical protein
MSAGKMHADKVDADASLVGRLLAAQVPELDEAQMYGSSCGR